MLHHDSKTYPLLHYRFTEEHVIDSQLYLDEADYATAIFAFVLNQSVQVTLHIKGDTVVGKASGGDLFYIPSQSTCTVQSRTNYPAKVVLVYFRYQNVETKATSWLGQQVIGQKDHELLKVQLPQIHDWVQAFLKANATSGLVSYYLVQSHLYSLASTFLNSVQRPVAEEGNLLEYVKQIKQNMLERYESPMDMEEIARCSRVSPSRFYQMFRKQTGLSPHKFITSVRLSKSLSLLGSSQLPVMDVAHFVGYTDELYFSRVFKKHMGISPTEFSRLAQKRVANLTPVFQGDLSVLGITPQLVLHRGWIDEAEKYVKVIEDTQPELILAPDLPEELFQELSKITSVIMLKWKGQAWRERLLKISRVMGIPTVAERWLTYFDMKVRNAKLLVKEHLGEKPFLLVSVHTDLFRVYGLQRRKIADLFYGDMELTAPDCAKEIGFADFNSLSQAAALDCDNVLFLVPSSCSEEETVELEREWRKYKQTRSAMHCIFIRFPAPLLYNAAFYENLIDQLVTHLLQSHY